MRITADVEPALIALAGTAAGAVVFKVSEYILGREHRREQQFTADLRRDIRLDTVQLRTQLTQVDQQLEELDDEIGRWRSKYYQLVEAVSRHDLARAQQIIKEES